MDAADRVSMSALYNRNPGKVDPLRGMDIVGEYEKIKAGNSTLIPRIQEMIRTRYLTGS